MPPNIGSGNNVVRNRISILRLPIRRDRNPGYGEVFECEGRTNSQTDPEMYGTTLTACPGISSLYIMTITNLDTDPEMSNGSKDCNSKTYSLDFHLYFRKTTSFRHA